MKDWNTQGKKGKVLNSVTMFMFTICFVFLLLCRILHQHKTSVSSVSGQKFKVIIHNIRYKLGRRLKFFSWNLFNQLVITFFHAVKSIWHCNVFWNYDKVARSSKHHLLYCTSYSLI